MEDTFKLTLRRPVSLAGETLTELVLREPTIDELDRAQNKGSGPTGTAIYLLVYVTGVSEALIRKMGVGDFQRASTWVGGFISGGLETGEASSPKSPASTDGGLGTRAA